MTPAAVESGRGPRLHFMTFAARSGSTIVARSLSECVPGLLVLPEFRTVEFLLARSESRVRRLRPRDLARILAADRQLGPNLGIDAAGRAGLADRFAGAGTAELLVAIMSTYVGGAALPNDVVIKLGTAAEFVTRLVHVSPTGSLVHVYRDGRATTSSLLQTPRAYFEGETMGRGDLAHCCGLWVRHQRSVRRAVSSGYPVHHVRYESFLRDPPGTCAQLFRVMAGPGEPQAPVRSFAVSGHEAGMHTLVGRPPAIERTDAWVVELSRTDQVFASWRMARELDALGYASRLEPTAGRPEVLRSIVRTFPRHCWLLARYAVRRASQYACRPGELAEHINARAVTLLNRRGA